MFEGGGGEQSDFSTTEIIVVDFAEIGNWSYRVKSWR